MLKLLPLPLFAFISNLVWTIAVNFSLCYLFLHNTNVSYRVLPKVSLSHKNMITLLLLA